LNDASSHGHCLHFSINRNLNQPKPLNAQILRRSRWRLVWSWGRLLYRSAAVSFSALQLYQNPWLLRAVLSALWASSRLLYAQVVV